MTTGTTSVSGSDCGYVLDRVHLLQKEHSVLPKVERLTNHPVFPIINAPLRGSLSESEDEGRILDQFKVRVCQ